MKNNILKIVFILFVFISFGVQNGYCAPENSVELQPKIQIEETTQPVETKDNLDKAVDEAVLNVEEVKTPKVDDLKVMTPNANKEIRDEVVQHANKELNFTLKKLGAMMLGVIISSVIIFLILSFLNKLNAFKTFKLKSLAQEEKHLDTDEKEENIEAPSSIDEALKVFFDKTK